LSLTSPPIRISIFLTRTVWPHVICLGIDDEECDSFHENLPQRDTSIFVRLPDPQECDTSLSLGVHTGTKHIPQKCNPSPVLVHCNESNGPTMSRQELVDAPARMLLNSHLENMGSPQQNNVTNNSWLSITRNGISQFLSTDNAIFSFTKSPFYIIFRHKGYNWIV